MRLLFDLEADGLLPTITKIHCLCAADLDTNQRYEWGPDEIDDAIATLDKADEIAGHYILFYDLPAITKVKGWKPRPEQKIRDTFVASRLIHPSIQDGDEELIRRGKMPRVSAYSVDMKGKPKQLAGRHSIEAWGYRLGEHKVGADITEWAEWSQAVQDRCVGDVSTNVRLYNFLRIHEYSEAAMELEHAIALLCEAMTQEGWPFDVEQANALYSRLIGEREKIENDLIEQFGFWYSPISPDPAKYTFVPKKDNTKLGYVAGAPCCKIEQITFNPGSDIHVARVLQNMGWRPAEFTPGGRPSVDETILTGLVERFPQAEGLARHRLLKKRLSQLADGDKGWTKAVKEDGRIHGSYNPMGTITGRAAHFDPNIGQVPSVESPFGKECRSLFYVPDGWKIVGADMEGLELRCLGHYLAKNDGGAYGRAVTEGDPHWMTVNALDFVTGEKDPQSLVHKVVRKGSKTWLYAKIYGCAGLKSGLTLLEICQAVWQVDPTWKQPFFKTNTPGETELKRVGYKMLDQFNERIIGLAELVEMVKKLHETHGWLPGLDRRRVPSRSDHSSLNTLLQSAGAILCKRWGVDSFHSLSSKYQHGWNGEFVFLGWIHDEYQVAAREGLQDEVGETLVRFAQSAGEPYGFRVPLASKYSVGQNWSDTH